MMNNSVVLLLVLVAILLRIRQREGASIAMGRVWTVFVAVLAMHAVIIGGVMAYTHFMHS